MRAVSQCKILNKSDEVVGTSSRIKGMYKINTKSATGLSASIVVTSTLWHRKFAHVNPTDSEKLKKWLSHRYLI